MNRVQKNALENCTLKKSSVVREANEAFGSKEIPRRKAYKYIINKGVVLKDTKD